MHERVNSKSYRNRLKHSGVAGGKWKHAPRGTGLGGASAHFCSHLKRILSRNLDQRMLKNAYFLEYKNAKITSASGAPLPNPCWPRRLGSPPPDPHVITPANYCKFVEFISSTKCVLLSSKTQQNNYSKCFFIFASSAAFALTFHFKLYSVC